jgi:predicted acetyltransferase
VANIELMRAAPRDDTTIRNLYQLYFYEFTRFMTHWHVNYAGRYTEDDLDNLWHKSYRHTYLIKVDGELAGFAIIDDFTSEKPSAECTNIVVEEFFIMAAFQARGIAEQVATRLFDMYYGQWEVFVLEQNARAHRFWRRVIDRYTNSQYQEMPSADGRGMVRYFDNSRKKSA